ncbi:MAG: PEP-CTERM sorting domain-containing protein [Gemmatimonadaceae bacterium]
MKSKTLLQFLATISCCYALSLHVRILPAQSTAKPIIILFVGNSFFHGAYQPVRSYNAANVTDENAGVPAGQPRAEAGQGPYGGIPGIFKKMTDELGLNYEVHSELASGRALEFHYQNALPLISQSKWNVVVMHDLSTGPVPTTRTGKPDVFTKHADLLEQAIHAANKTADVYLYETWSRADLTYRATGPYHDEKISAMARDLHNGYCHEFKQNGKFRGIAAAGDAWMDAIGKGIALEVPANAETGKINLWGADSYHPSIYGAYLNALVLVKQITGKDPTKLGASDQAAAELGVAPAIATSLQRLATEQRHQCF